ncbi:MAG: DUF1707 and DUF2154 domain-containing protein [Actinobacteria bacterium]|nr:DUF1707 and DUF2154 domain-containing protein [Actinomycetota bacterium]
MTEQPPTPDAVPDPDRIRASDADRERVAGILHQAMGEGRLTITEVDERLRQVYAARTIGELRPVTHDLPGHELAFPEPQLPATAPYAAPDVRPGARVRPGPASGSAVAIMSGAERKGAWTVPERFHAVAVLGGVELDLTEASFAAAEVTIDVFALMGGIQITVPDDVSVECHAFGFMGGVDNKANPAPPPGSPVVRIAGFAMMGGVDITPPKRRRLGRG